MKNVNELLSLENKCAVVVGGKGIIGLSISEALAEMGAEVYIASPNSDNNDKSIKTLRERGLAVYGKSVDQSSESSVESLIIDILNKSNSSPSILFNCGVHRPMKKYFNDSTSNWDKSMEVNSRGLFITCRSFANVMKNNGGGSIINISSIYGLVAPDKAIYEGTEMNTEPDYPYNKGGMIMFSKYLSSYLAEYNIRVNCIAPGGIYNKQPKDFIDKYIRKVPLNRMGSKEDLKGISVFLASEASSYITGTVIPIDGGLTSL